jgi:mRNA-degrading endonuclease RelE of RelBE toxin-antitoxin system
VAYSVHFRVDLDAVPEPARGEIRRTVDQIAEALDTVPASSPFWRSARDSILQIDVLNFRVVYRIDERKHDVLVVELDEKQHD